MTISMNVRGTLQELSVTEDHNMMVHREDKVELIPAKKVMPGDRLLVDRKFGASLGEVLSVQSTMRSHKNKLVTEDGTVFANSIHATTICDGSDFLDFGDVEAALAAWRRMHSHLVSPRLEILQLVSEEEALHDVTSDDIDKLEEAEVLLKKWDLDGDGNVTSREVLASGFNLSLANFTSGTVNKLLERSLQAFQDRTSEGIKKQLFDAEVLAKFPGSFATAIREFDLDADHDGDVSSEDLEPFDWFPASSGAADDHHFSNKVAGKYDVQQVRISDFETVARPYIRRFALPKVLVDETSYTGRLKHFVEIPVLASVLVANLCFAVAFAAACRRRARISQLDTRLHSGEHPEE